jgi:hypothetical protein
MVYVKDAIHLVLKQIAWVAFFAELLASSKLKFRCDDLA